MTGETENLILEHLRHMRARLDEVSLEVADIKSRLTAMDENLGLIRTDIGHLHTMYANQSRRMDRVDERLGRIEKRLDMVEA